MGLLKIELVPESLWNKNLRNSLTSSQWDCFRRKCYKLANYVCEYCGGVGEKHPVECHEKWEYNDETHVQKLIGFVALCPDCHEVKHIGFAKLNGRFGRAVRHLAKVNVWELGKAIKYTERVYAKWEDRNKFHWSQNFDYLKDKNQLTLF